MQNVQWYIVWMLPVLIGCENFPKDPEHTLSKVIGGTLKVGITHHPPFTVVSGDSTLTPGGIEVELVESFARELNAQIVWVHETESQLFKMLKSREIDMVIGGITQKSPWKTHAGFSRPYLKREKEKYVMAISPGENAFLMRIEKFLARQTQGIFR